MGSLLNGVNSRVLIIATKTSDSYSIDPLDLPSPYFFFTHYFCLFFTGPLHDEIGKGGQVLGARVSPIIFESRLFCFKHRFNSDEASLITKRLPRVDGAWRGKHILPKCVWWYNEGQSGPSPHSFEDCNSLSADALEHLFALSLREETHNPLDSKKRIGKRQASGRLGRQDCGIQYGLVV